MAMNKYETATSIVALSKGDALLVNTNVKSPGALGEAEKARIEASLRMNGVAVIRGFMKTAAIGQLRDDALTAVSDDFDFGIQYGFELQAKNTPGTCEFFHPFLYSNAASALVTTPDLVGVVEQYLDSPAIIHHALFQLSKPVDQPTVDWHVDTGSNKFLNGSQRFPDRRLRMIVYLSDVKSGGLAYILDSRDATKRFMNLPIGQLFPEIEVPQDPERRIVIEELAGTIILFDAHGLHRPEAPNENRLVLNTWFARRDFSAKLPPVLVSVASVPEENAANVRLFANARGFTPDKLKKRPAAKPSRLAALKALFR